MLSECPPLPAREDIWQPLFNDMIESASLNGGMYQKVGINFTYYGLNPIPPVSMISLHAVPSRIHWHDQMTNVIWNFMGNLRNVFGAYSLWLDAILLFKHVNLPFQQALFEFSIDSEGKWVANFNVISNEDESASILYVCENCTGKWS